MRVDDAGTAATGSTSPASTPTTRGTPGGAACGTAGRPSTASTGATTDYTSPSPATSAVLEALSRRLGRPITYEEAGLGTTSSVAGLDVAPEHALNTIEGLVDTGRADMDPSRRAVLTTALYSATLALPSFDEADETLDRLEHQAAGRTVRIGPGDVAAIRSMTDRIADILDELGGAHARPMAAAFIVNSVSSYLHADGTEDVKNGMRAAASDLVYLTGWMAMYEKAHGLGQRYYRQALGLAKAGEDQVTYCRTLRGMALQAANLKLANEALSLADTAAEAAPSAGPRLQAFLRGQQVHGASLVGDRRLAFSRLDRGHEGFQQRPPADGEAG
ncbi:hypothetical protein [Streptomyces pseudovenezuelae]|uniref:Transcriptional regulator n=1 Tax=Streptomyces pseudovenezuelae TaxID=67350 RepID=A0ABT6LV40_9ACTN|nr:hypothetical protein [Streptomyces pseudovenezuelae]